MLCGSQMRPILCLMILTSYLMVRGSIRGAKRRPRTARPTPTHKKNYTRENNLQDEERNVGIRRRGNEEVRQEDLIVRKTPIFDYFAWLLENKFVNTPSIYTLGNNFFRRPVTALPSVVAVSEDSPPSRGSGTKENFVWKCARGVLKSVWPVNVSHGIRPRILTILSLHTARLDPRGSNNIEPRLKDSRYRGVKTGWCSLTSLALVKTKKTFEEIEKEKIKEGHGSFARQE